MPLVRIVALVTIKGTACAETALYGPQDTAENRACIDRLALNDPGPDAPLPGQWVDVTDNEYIRAQFETEEEA